MARSGIPGAEVRRSRPWRNVFAGLLGAALAWAHAPHGDAAAISATAGRHAGPLPAGGGGATPSSGGTAGRSGRGMSHYGPAPQPDPRRRISVRDCSRPFEPDGGNLLCK